MYLELLGSRRSGFFYGFLFRFFSLVVGVVVEGCGFGCFWMRGKRCGLRMIGRIVLVASGDRMF